MTGRAAPGPAEVHLWRADLDLAAAELDALTRPLSGEERARAQRFHHRVDQDRFACGRGWLRHLLGAYLGRDPASLVLANGPHGKPRLEDAGASWLRFNVSHSGPAMVFAVADGRDVGVDIERIREDVDVLAVARRFLSTRQHAELAALSDPQRTAAFFATWTRSEAYVKGLGVGLLSAGHEPDRAPGWSVAGFDSAPGYASAVAVEGDGVTVPVQAEQLIL